MISFSGWLQSIAFALCIGSLVACSPKTVVSSSLIDESASLESDTISFAVRALRDTIPEYMVSRSSWENYQYALQAIDNEEWLLAGHYLDVSLKQLDILFRDYPTLFRKLYSEATGYDGIVVNFATSSHVVAWFTQQVKVI